MINQIHYLLKTTSMTGNMVNATVTYDVYYDINKGLAYEVELKTPAPGSATEMSTAWHAKILYQNSDQKRLEYDIIKRIYYQTRQIIQVERALYDLQEDLSKFFQSSKITTSESLTTGEGHFPGYTLYTLTIWIDPVKYLPMRRENRDRGNLITDEFTYFSVNEPLPDGVFSLTKPAEAIADFDLYPEAPTLPRFEVGTEMEKPQFGIYVDTLLTEIKRHVILNQWEYGPFATIKLPWLTEMPVKIYLRKSEDVFPPVIVVFEVPGQGNTYFFINYSYLGYVVTGFTQDEFDLGNYQNLPITTSVMLKDLVPLYAAPSLEKSSIINNFVRSVQSNDFFIDAYDMGNKSFDLTIKNFSFHENEGYLTLNVYGKEYWDTANLEAKFNYIVTGQMADAHTTPIIIYALNTLKRQGIYRFIVMPQYNQF